MRRRVRPAPGRLADADPRGRAPGRPDRARRRRRHRGGGAAGPARGGAPRPVDPAGRARPGAGPAAAGDGRTGRGLRASPCTCWARAARTASARCWPARWCSPPAAWARSSRPPPTRRSPPATAWRWRCGPARRSPTWSSSSSTRPRCRPGRPGCPVPAASSRWSREALRGEGAHLVDADGKRFMVGQHELAELAPRDVVAKGIHRVLLATGADHVYLDARHLGARLPGRSGSRPSWRPAGRPASTRRPT